MRELLPGFGKLIEECKYTPAELCDLADFDSRMLEVHNGKPIIRKAEARKEYEIRAYALKIAAQVVWLHRIQK